MIFAYIHRAYTEGMETVIYELFVQILRNTIEM